MVPWTTELNELVNNQSAPMTKAPDQVGLFVKYRDRLEAKISNAKAAIMLVTSETMMIFFAMDLSSPVFAASARNLAAAYCNPIGATTEPIPTETAIAL